MNRHIIYRSLLVLTLACQIACGQTPPKLESGPFSFVDSLLRKDTYTVEILDFSFPKDLQEIALRFQKSMAENKEWAQEYFSKNYKEGEGLPYNEKFGITREEYQKIKDIEKTPPTIIVKDTGAIKCNRTGNRLIFRSIHNNTYFFESLSIDFKNELIMFRNDTIPFLHEINAPATTPFGEWHGYIWKKETSNLGEKDDIKMEKMISRIVEIDFGEVRSTGKTLFRLKYNEVNKGQVIANFEQSCYLD